MSKNPNFKKKEGVELMEASESKEYSTAKPVNHLKVPLNK